jgi:hypothetical protein
MNVMRQLIFILIFTFFINACNKDNNTTTNQSETYLKYEINGQQIEAIGNLPLNFTANESGVLCYVQLKQNGFQNTFYQILARASYKERINLYIPFDTLEVKSYYMDSTLFVRTIGNLSLAHNDTVYRLNRNLDYATINISSYNNGRISGMFDCNLSYYNVSSNTFSQAKVSKGIFQNVKVYQ